ncbi:MAG: sensor histidine kinase [Chloroflexota bacterium]|nr:sensor histidine kinase [Chloroflexota bacterium]
MLRRQSQMMSAPVTQPSSVAARPDLHSDDINRLRDQLWVGFFVTTIVVLVITSVARRLMGDVQPLLSYVLLITLVSIAVAGLYLLRTRYAPVVQGIYVVCIHLAVPPVLVLYGGTRGFGDVALLTAVFVSLLYGWRRWMIVTFGVMAVTLAWVLYHDIIGDPVAPLLNYSAQFTSLKFFILMLFTIFLVRYSNAFYNSLLERYRRFAKEQVLLNQELQVSRQKIVTTREEERRRLRRDLHDGLGPTLAAQMFRIGAAQSLLQKNPEKTAAILDELQTGIENTLTSIRQLVYELRPPMLDQLGLSGAISDFVTQVDRDGKIKLTLPEQLPPLNAALEVAAFRIMQTGLDNVIKHAQATSCDARMTVTKDHLHIEIVDNGIGIAEKYRAGVGLTSMRERTDELGGSFAIVPVQPHGTRLSVSFPLLLTAEANKDTQDD